jgi:hypothetical protein
MSLRRAEPKDRPDWKKWECVRLKPKESFKGWLVGPPHGFETHYYYATKPCVHEITSGQVECKHCVAKSRKEYQAYVPFFTHFAEWWVIIVGRKEYERIKQIPIWAFCEVVKPRAITVSPRVSYRDLDVNRLTPPGIRERGAVDLTDWLLNLWQETALTEWYAAQPPTNPPVVMSPLDPPVTTEEPAKKRRGKTVAQLTSTPLANGQHEVKIEDMDGKKTMLGDLIKKIAEQTAVNGNGHLPK